jgi:uncharacterized protein YecE (DUF72 family)
MIRVGIGGWVFEEWRGTFYPPKLPHAQELAHASRALTAIEINSTFYRAQSPASFKKWAAETPEDFVFSVKGPMSVVGRKALGESKPLVEKFLQTGVLELGQKLGPLFWQMTPYKRFDEAEMRAFFEALPNKAGKLRLRHAIEVQHKSFVDPAFVSLAKAAGVAIVYVDSAKHPPIADLTADFSYARLERTQEAEETGYPKAAIDAWALRAKQWAEGVTPKDLARIVAAPAEKTKREVFIYFISGAKVRAPAAAMALIERLR